MRKTKIPKALREQVWLTWCGKKFEHKCLVDWCSNIVTPFNYEVGHNIPESKGGKTDIDNLRPLCSSCNKSMGANYTIDEFSEVSRRATHFFECFRFEKSRASRTSSDAA